MCTETDAEETKKIDTWEKVEKEPDKEKYKDQVLGGDQEEVELGGLDGLNGDGVESLRGTKRGGEISKWPHKKWKGSKARGEEEVTLMKQDLNKIKYVVASVSEDQWNSMETQ